MNAQDVKRFDELHERKKSGEVFDRATEVDYQVLLERVVLGKDGKSEFPTDDTEIMAALKRKALCEDAAKRIFDEAIKQAAIYGPAVLPMLVKLLGR